MPHVIIEYSANIEAELDLPRLMELVRDAALGTGLYAPEALRIRCARRDHYLLADGDPRNGFLHVTYRIRKGRDDETRRAFGESQFLAIERYLKPLYESRPMAFNLEVHEVPDLSYRTRTIGRGPGDPERFIPPPDK